MLFDIDMGCKKVIPRNAESYELIQLAKSRLQQKTIDKMIRTIDLALDNCVPSESSKLTWTSCAALIGYSSKEPTASTDHLWRFAAESFMSHTKTTNMFVGGLVRWRISLREETWLCARDERNELDIDTGKPIKIATYWINDKFKAPESVAVEKFTMADLASKFNKRAFA